MNKIAIIISLIVAMAVGVVGCINPPEETAPTIESEPAETAVATPELVSPHTGATGIELTPVLLWADVPNAKGYELWLSRDYAFSDIIHSVSLAGTACQVRDGLNPSTRYYWMVIAKAKLADPETPIACSPVWTLTTAPADFITTNIPTGPSAGEVGRCH